MGWRQNYYQLNNPDKYLGDPNNVFYRSSWELSFFKFCDNNPNVIAWASEEIAIPYMKPTPSGGFKPARYFPDIYMEYQTTSGEVIKEIVEIKPLKQTKKSRAKKERVKMQENAVYVLNQIKWEAAKKWCDERGIKFSVKTEKSIYK